MRLFSDDNLATANIWAESRGESYIGKIAVGEVMRNRMRLKYFSNGTVADTVFRAKQFSGFNDGNPWRNVIFTIDTDFIDVQECLKAWIESETSNYAKGAVLYANLNIVHPIWAMPSDLVSEIEAHSFFLPSNLRGK